jgi:hypothetical protein
MPYHSGKRKNDDHPGLLAIDLSLGTPSQIRLVQRTTGENRLLWWSLHQGEYREIAPAADGFLKSGVFPGLRLDASALQRGDMKAVLATLRRGLDSPEHGSLWR